MVICADHSFKEEYRLMDRKPLHEMLGALIDKIPSKVGNNSGGGCSRRVLSTQGQQS